MLEELKLPPALLAHALDLDEVARIDRAGEVTLVVMRVPSVMQTAVPTPFRSFALGVFLRKDRIVTVTGGHTEVIDDLVARGEVPDSPAAFVLSLLLVVTERFLANLRRVEQAVEATEAQRHR